MVSLRHIIWIAIAVSLKLNAQTLSLTITNPSDIQRQEVVETDLDTICQKLGIGHNDSLVVRNALGQEMTYQKSYDGKLLLMVSMQPQGKVVYTISKGKPSIFKSYVHGRIYPERLDDLTWENDRGIYRFYGPALQRSGEKSYGTDVWVKNTPELVVEERYRLHNWGWHQADSLKKAGKPKEGSDFFMNHSFHLDHGYGMDVYFNKLTVWYDGIKTPMSLATGIVLHGEENLILDSDYVLYADPTDNPKVHQSQIYVGTLFPNGINEHTILKGPKSHAIGMVHPYKGTPYTYYFGSAWSLYDVSTFAHWKLLADEYLIRIKHPLQIRYAS